MSRFSIAKDKILDDLEGVIEQLLNGRRKDKRLSLWNVANPYRAKSKPEQMAVWLQGARRGAWKDFVSGETGDAIDLVAYGLTGTVNADTRMTALEWAEDRYGLKDMSRERREQIAAEGKSRKLASQAKENQRREKSIARARKFFFSCQEDLVGTPVETYLASRWTPLSAIPNLNRSLRYHPACEYWMLPDRPRLPAQIAAMVDVNGRIGANHYTFLQPDGSDKAAVPKAKLMFPETSGLVIRLTNGPSGLSAEDASRAGISGYCAVCEGIEDGTSIARASPDLRVWPAGSLSGLLTVPDHPCVSGWMIFKDNDWGKPQAAALFERGVRRIRSFGKPVEVVAMPADWGKDVNDAISKDEW